MGTKGGGLERRKSEADVVEYLRSKAKDVAENDKVSHNRAVTLSAGRDTLFFGQFQTAIKEVFQEAFPVIKPIKKSQVKSKRILHTILSDTHYGSALDPREVGHKYGSIEEARRTASICRQVAEYKLDHRAETELYLHVLGDMIQGQLYDARDGLPLAEQVASAIRILVQCIKYYSVQFQKVTVFCTPGNHGRNKARHHQRAINQKHDAVETMVYIALKEVANFLPNVTVKIGYEPKYDFDAFGFAGFATHGDTVLNVGYPGKSIDVSSMTRQVNSINSARASKGLKPYKLFIVGHVHTGTLIRLPGGVTIITNSCLLPTDAYAQSIGIFDSDPGQWLWESVEGHMVGDARFMEVGEKDDNDATLDYIIKPYTGL